MQTQPPSLTSYTIISLEHWPSTGTIDAEVTKDGAPFGRASVQYAKGGDCNFMWRRARLDNEELTPIEELALISSTFEALFQATTEKNKNRLVPDPSVFPLTIDPFVVVDPFGLT